MKDYITRAPRIINGNLVIVGFIKKSEEKRAEDAFIHFCGELMRNKQISIARENTNTKMGIPLEVKEVPKTRFSQKSPTYEVYVG